MIAELVTFFILIGVGGGVWYLLNYVLAILFNYYAVHWPTYYADPTITFLISVCDWGMLLICLIPAIIYLWTNTQRPEAVR